VGVVVVGAGISGIACARVLADAGVAVRVLERARVPGGRMATKRYGDRRVDIGAAYFTARDEGFTALAREWRASGLAREWTDTLQVVAPDGRGSTPELPRWAAPHGLRSLVADLAARLDVRTDHEVRKVEPGPRVDGVPADAVVLAMPGPQALRVLHPSLRAAREAASGQRWLPVLAATLRYPNRSWSDFDGAFVNEDAVLAGVFDDGARRGDDAPVIVAHTTADFAERHLAEPSAAADEIAAAVSRVLEVPAPVETHVHRWTYARPADAADRPFHMDDQGIGMCGDAWGSPRVETAWLSGTRLGTALAARLAG
jgi:predicted NAD/FAD-dependent oxidoreductase